MYRMVNPNQLLFIMFRLYYIINADLDFWLQEIEAKLTADELGHDLGSIDLLLKKQQLQEADIKAHEVL